MGVGLLIFWRQQGQGQGCESRCMEERGEVGGEAREQRVNLGLPIPLHVFPFDKIPIFLFFPVYSGCQYSFSFIYSAFPLSKLDFKTF
ncbi:hypothetical protein BDZ91DRAFT_421541 [Kalaharituber pfeilii]|nr:hypothetical protein BDZ91DRAFT_421541 [Kalaharituber pfeilii]